MSEEKEEKDKSSVLPGRYFGVEYKSDTQRVYHSRLRLLDDGWQIHSGYKGVEVIQDGETPIFPILKFFLDIDGVTSAEIRAYQVTVNKDGLFSWEEIESCITPLWMGIKTAIEATDPTEIEWQKILLTMGPEAAILYDELKANNKLPDLRTILK